MVKPKTVKSEFDLDDIRGRSKKEKMIRTTIRMPKEMHLDAVKYDINVSKVTRQALTMILDKLKKVS